VPGCNGCTLLQTTSIFCLGSCVPLRSLSCKRESSLLFVDRHYVGQPGFHLTTTFHLD
jgi:hypothetical protein